MRIAQHSLRARAAAAAALATAFACTGGGPSREESSLSPSGEPAAGAARAVPDELAERLAELNNCQSRLQDTHATYRAQRIQAEADEPSILYAFYNLDSRAIANPFTRHRRGVNDDCELFVNDAIGAVRAVIEPKEGAPVDPSDPESLVDIFTDVCGVRVINNESGWYEGWLMHDIRVPRIAAATTGGRAPFGRITQADADLLAAMGSGHNTPGRLFTRDGEPVSAVRRSNTVVVPVSLGAWNTLQGEDGHAYWELNEYTNFSFPLYERLGTGSTPEEFRAGAQYQPLGGGLEVDSRIPGSGPSGILNNTTVEGKVAYGDDPLNPRDPDRAPDVCGEESDQSETRLRFIPSGLAREILLDVYLRPASFEPKVSDRDQRLLDAYAAEVARLDEDKNGVLSFEEVEIEGTSDGMSNERLYIPPNQFGRIAITREIDDGLLAPRFFDTSNAFILHGRLRLVSADGVSGEPVDPRDLTD